ncbi:MAG: PadR family transcriptional regulator, partial [Candidatus Zixiibacteriota bacterium]
MPRANKTEFAVLGLLSLSPMSGYDMKAFISQSIGYFWQESYGQLYPAL